MLIFVNRKGVSIVLKPKQKKCIEYMIEGNLKDKEIAEKINVAPKTICEWKKQKEFQEEYDRQIRENIRYAAGKAFNRQKQLLKSRGMVAFMASKDILDRAGFKPVEKVEQEVDMELNIVVDYGTTGAGENETTG